MRALRFIQFIITPVVMLNVGSALAAEKIQEDAIEGEPRVFFLGEDLNGAIRGQICDTCPEVKLVITPDSKAFVDNKRVELSVMSKGNKKPELTFYNIKTKKVTRMYWRSK